MAQQKQRGGDGGSEREETRRESPRALWEYFVTSYEARGGGREVEHDLCAALDVLGGDGWEIIHLEATSRRTDTVGVRPSQAPQNIVRYSIICKRPRE
jgi:hypothetical protein